MIPTTHPTWNILRGTMQLVGQAIHPTAINVPLFRKKLVRGLHFARQVSLKPTEREMEMKILQGSGMHLSVMHFHVRLLCFWMLLSLAFSANFTDLFQPFWAPDHIVNEGNLVKLALDNTSGCGIRSRRNYMFGLASVQIKLIEGDSAGTVTAFYMSSDGPNHDELDFEFLGNVSGEPYLVQTNVYVNGTGNREQRHSLWFDPTADFHSYSFLWNHHFITFLIDGIPIRVFTNKKEEIGVPYPKNQGMGIYGSVWNADDWATQGGRVKTDWGYAPFISAFRSFNIDACEYLAESDGTVGKCREGGLYWWDKPAFNSLSLHQSHQLKWVRAKHLVYDYCKDTGRFSKLPRECLS